MRFLMSLLIVAILAAEAAASGLCGFTFGPITCSPHTCGPITCGPITCRPHTCTPHTCGPITCSPHTCAPHTCGPITCSPHTCTPHTCGPITCTPHTCGPITCTPMTSAPHGPILQPPHQPVAPQEGVSANQAKQTVRTVARVQAPNTAVPSETGAGNVRAVSTAQRPAPEPPNTVSREDRGWLVLHVEKSAEITINDRPTRSMGPRRVYFMRMSPGDSCLMRIHLVHGKTIIDRQVVLEAGDTKTVYLRDEKLAAK